MFWSGDAAEMSCVAQGLPCANENAAFSFTGFELTPFNEHLPVLLKLPVFLCREPRSSTQSALVFHAGWSRARRGCPQPLPWEMPSQPGCHRWLERALLWARGGFCHGQCCPVGGSEALASVQGRVAVLGINSRAWQGVQDTRREGSPELPVLLTAGSSRFQKAQQRTHSSANQGSSGQL